MLEQDEDECSGTLSYPKLPKPDGLNCWRPSIFELQFVDTPYSPLRTGKITVGSRRVALVSYSLTVMDRGGHMSLKHVAVLAKPNEVLYADP